MSVDPVDARQDLDLVERAERAARRNSIDNGAFYLVWGVAIVVGLSLFDLFANWVAIVLWMVIAFAATIWTVLDARRYPVQPRRFFNHFIWWGFYYAAILIGGILLFPSRPPFLFTAIGVLSAAPILIIGVRQWLRAREASHAA
jgi:hypothetical protein